MNKLVLTLIPFLFISTALLAGQPPSWNNFDVQSVNKKYVARISLKPETQSPMSIDRPYQIAVYERNGEQEVFLWSADYIYDSYAGGQLSDDGSTFAFVNFWYERDKPIVYIYQQDLPVRSFQGKDFDLDSGRLQKTGSQTIWLDIRYPPCLLFVFDEQGGLFLDIKTIDKKTHRIDFQRFEIKVIE